MKIILLTLLLTISGLQSQEHKPYYPHLDNLFLNNKKESYNYFVYNKTNLITELLRIRQKTYYNNYSSSYSQYGVSSFTDLEIIPLQQNIDNLFSTGINLCLLGDKKVHIPLTYNESFQNDGEQRTNRDFNKMESTLQLSHQDKVVLSFPFRMLNPFITNKDLNVEFFVSSIDTTIDKEKKTFFIATGRFSKAFYLKDSGVNSLQIKKLVFEFINDELSVKALYPASTGYHNDEYTESRSSILIVKVPFQL
ncbi:MAG: hypothetical protein LBE92_19380 [Chryseobacterium sp.]|jgi:hypothetical protein|uniref:hypothetical protein n=1 Tax=Chryseobacterium sp. TaxID=1871047 RepID=UPI0028175BEC|nr:hypothetical protein [Chryseobacterium sp.]MDR2238292.1 hypothetical protein [Chryseobacterium sp.]